MNITAIILEFNVALHYKQMKNMRFKEPTKGDKDDVEQMTGQVLTKFSVKQIPTCMDQRRESTSQKQRNLKTQNNEVEKPEGSTREKGTFHTLR